MLSRVYREREHLMGGKVCNVHKENTRRRGLMEAKVMKRW